MKNYYIFVFSLFIVAFLACSSSSSPSLPQNAAERTILEQDSVIYDTIEVWRDSIWEEIEKKWTEEAFQPCLKKNKIKISCGSCTGVYMELNFYINSEGKLDKYEVLRSRYCEKPGIEACMMDYFKNMKFPEKYYNKTFKTRLGRYLKC